MQRIADPRRLVPQRVEGRRQPNHLAQRLHGGSVVELHEWPVERPPDWTTLVQIEAARETEELRHAVISSTPYGPDAWRDRFLQDEARGFEIQRVQRDVERRHASVGEATVDIERVNAL